VAISLILVYGQGVRRHQAMSEPGPVNENQPLPVVSVVIPARNEAQNLPRLIEEIRLALIHQDHEIIVVDDGSTDDTLLVLQGLVSQRKGEELVIVRHERSAGQSAGVRSGLMHARSPLVATLDGDGQNDPRFFVDMLELFEQAGPELGMVGGQRVGRKDTGMKRWASRFANGLRQKLLNDQTRDSGCGIKIIRRDVMLRLPYFNGWHRFMAALVLREGYHLRFVDVIDRPRQHGQSNYGIFDRALVGILDLFGVWWLRKRFRPYVAPASAEASASRAARGIKALPASSQGREPRR
jgi:dolichol-phosphate mannosyltransferase